MNQIEYTFRDPNLLIQSIKDMQQKQEESLKEIQSKDQNKRQLESYKWIRTKFVIFKTRTTSLFGSIRLFGFSNLDLFKSQIQIEGNQQSIDSLCNAIRCDPKGGPSFGEGSGIQRSNMNNE